MTDVVIAGIGQAEVGEHWDISLRDLALKAIAAARHDAGELQPQALFVGNMHAPVMSDQAHLGALVADYAGMTGIEASTVEAGGASGGAALRMGYLAVASGQADVVLVVGVEKVTDKIGPKSEAAFATSTDSDYEAVHGLTPTAQAALVMRRYMHEYNVPHEAFAGFAVTAHANAVTNPYAMFRTPITTEAYQRAGMVSAPLNLYDAAPTADGAAAVILTRSELLPDTRYPQVHITGSAMSSDRLALHDRGDLLAFDAARKSAQRALQHAEVKPGDLDLFELCDSYTVYAALSLEATGFAMRGLGWKLALENQIGLKGLLPVSTFGGLKARGNPGGATGVYQAVEATLQLRGCAGLNQVENARRAMIQVLGGPASNAVTHILEGVRR